MKAEGRRSAFPRVISDYARRRAAYERPGRYVVDHNRAGGDHRAIADLDAWADHRVGKDDYLVTDRDRKEKVILRTQRVVRAAGENSDTGPAIEPATDPNAAGTAAVNRAVRRQHAVVANLDEASVLAPRQAAEMDETEWLYVDALSERKVLKRSFDHGMVGNATGRRHAGQVRLR